MAMFSHEQHAAARAVWDVLRRRHITQCMLFWPSPVEYPDLLFHRDAQLLLDNTIRLQDDEKLGAAICFAAAACFGVERAEPHYLSGGAKHPNLSWSVRDVHHAVQWRMMLTADNRFLVGLGDEELIAIEPDHLREERMRIRREELMAEVD